MCNHDQLKMDQRAQGKIRRSENDKGKLEQNTSMSRYSNGILKRTPAARGIVAGIDNGGSVQVSSFCTAKEAICREERWFTQ